MKILLKNIKIILAVTVILLYAIFKIYVINTPNPKDDAIPELVRDELLDLINT